MVAGEPTVNFGQRGSRRLGGDPDPEQWLRVEYNACMRDLEKDAPLWADKARAFAHKWLERHGCKSTRTKGEIILGVEKLKHPHTQAGFLAFMADIQREWEAMKEEANAISKSKVPLIPKSPQAAQVESVSPFGEPLTPEQLAKAQRDGEIARAKVAELQAAKEREAMTGILDAIPEEAEKKINLETGEIAIPDQEQSELAAHFGAKAKPVLSPDSHWSEHGGVALFWSTVFAHNEVGRGEEPEARRAIITVLGSKPNEWPDYDTSLKKAEDAIYAMRNERIAAAKPTPPQTPPKRAESNGAGSKPPAIENKPAPAPARPAIAVVPNGNNPFKPATREGTKLRMALYGPSGSGKTYTALNIACNILPDARVAVIDTERGSARKYANLFKFDVLELRHYHPDKYVQAIQAAVQYGYDVLIIDSLSHAWMGAGGVLSIVDQKGGRFDAWKDATPLHLKLIDAMLDAPIHLIATMRSKTEYVVETIEQNGRQKSVPRKLGLAPVQRDGMEYEFDVCGEIDPDSIMHISKSRCPDLNGQQFPKAGSEVASALMKWLAA